MGIKLNHPCPTYLRYSHSAQEVCREIRLKRCAVAVRSHVPASDRVTSVAGVTGLKRGAAQIWDITGGTVPGFHVPPGRERKEVMHVAGVIARAGSIGLPSRAGWDVACLISELMLRTHVKRSACVLVLLLSQFCFCNIFIGTSLLTPSFSFCVFQSSAIGYWSTKRFLFKTTCRVLVSNPRCLIPTPICSRLLARI